MPEQVTEEQLKNMSPEQIAELQKQNCLFCHIASGKVPAKIVYEDEACIAFLDINPAARGHVLLIPKEHFMIMPQVPDETIAALSSAARKLSRAMISALSIEGTNIFIANGAVAGQKAPHLIVHIIPRTEGDGITCCDLPENQAKEEEVQWLQKSLASELGFDLDKTDKKLEEIDLKQLKKLLEE